MSVTALFRLVRRLHDAVFGLIGRLAGDWFLPTLARFAFFAVLYFYFLASAQTKLGDGLLGVLNPADAAYYQIALPAVEAAGGDVAQIDFLPWGLIVRLGTWAEFLLPAMIVLGLFARVAALGMIVFIGVQTLVDVTVHKVDAATIGALFDRFPDSLIADQRLLWLVPLLIVTVRGAGALSLDRILASRFPRT